MRARTNALDRHKLQIRAGDLMAVDISASALNSLTAGDAVVVQLYHDDRPEAQTVVRQFVPPGLLVTNSSGPNSLIDMDDSTLPFEAVIKGVVRSTIRPSNGQA